MTGIFRAVLVLAGALSLFACASQPAPLFVEGDGEEPQRRLEFAGGLVASPISLVMTDFDADRNRATTRAELDVGMDAAWPGLDANGDGEASGIEFADWARDVMGSDTAIPGRVAFDSNANGMISRGEFIAGLSVEFTRLDADSDGAIDRAELVRLVMPGMSVGPRPGARTFNMRRPDGSGGGPAEPEGGSEEAGPAE